MILPEDPAADRQQEEMNVLITLGPTQEPIDDVRYITTGSSGKMGAALAGEALRRGHRVTIVAGPVQIELPDKAKIMHVRTAEEMTKTTLRELEKGCDVFICSAAIADYTPAKKHAGKIKSGKTPLTLELKPTKKLTSEARRKFPNLRIVAFKAEYGVGEKELLKRAAAKLEKEGLDLICANDISINRFGSETNQVTLIEKSGEKTRLPKGAKSAVAKGIWDAICPVVR
jgi:phosphopantothenoylcysteine decarboxylase/phosphopantothenate--cysteine ligase